MKRFYILLLIIALLFGTMFTGCKAKKTEKKSEAEKPPTSLEDLHKLTDEVVIRTMKKDWSGSLSKTKEVQSKWNELYPDLQKKGVSKEVVDSFVKDLNTLSDSLIAKTLTLPKVKKEDAKSQESKSQSSDSSIEQSGSAQPGGQDTNGGESTEETNKDPQKTLEEVDPMIELANGELVIVNNSVELLKHIPKFTGLFGGGVPADVFQLKYLLYHINITSKEGNWPETEKAMKDITDIWKSVETKAMETDENLKIQIAQSIRELEGVASEKNEKLIGMKSNSTLEIVEKLMKAFQEKEK